jgi:hypothetical protein
MRPSFLILLLLLLKITAFTQSIRTIVPSRPIIIGTSFRLQFIISEPDALSDLIPPSFDGFQLVNGPNISSGVSLMDGKMQPVKNVSFILLPVRPGKIKISSIRGVKGFSMVGGEDIFVDVLPASPLAVLPGENKALSRFQLEENSIEESVFINTRLSRTTCFAGEPVVAEFTLFSGIESSSEAERSPAFYGFSVLDLVDFNEPHHSTELVKGKLFNTLLLRKVLLFPVQSGELLIDPMFVHSQVYVTDPSTGKRTLVEKELISRQLKLNVKPLPPGKPEGFSGAVGSFTLSAELQETSFPLNKQGRLIVSLKGKGNFIQVDQPSVQWPPGIEYFEPIIKDRIIKSEEGLEGERIYEYSFTSDSSGQFILPPVNFSFFDPQEKRYIINSTAALLFEVKPAGVVNRLKERAESSPWSFVLLVLGGIILLTLALYIFKTRNKKLSNSKSEKAEEKIVSSSFDPGFTPAHLMAMNGAEACSEIMKLLRQFELHPGTELNEGKRKEIAAIREECQMMSYAGAFDLDELSRIINRSFLVFSGKDHSAYL